MPDILVRHIDDAMAERIKDLARRREWSLNDVILHALRYGLGLSGSGPGSGQEHDTHDIAHLGGTWRPDETAAFQEAVDALARARPDRLVAMARDRD